MRLHDHGHACDCATHRSVSGATANSGLGPALLAVLACAICPACLALYAKLFSVFGVGFSLSEFQHLLLLSFAIGASLVLSAWRSWRTRRVWPIAVAVLGSLLIAAGHLAGELHVLEWAGVLVLLVGGLIEHFRLRGVRAPLTQSVA